MSNNKKYLGLMLAVLSLSACAKPAKYDLKTELNKFANPHGLSLLQLEQVDPEAPLPAVSLQASENPQENDIVLMMYAENASNETLCLAAASKGTIPPEEFKPITVKNIAYKKQIEEGVKWTSYIYYTYKDGACYFLEGNAYIKTMLKKYPPNEKMSEDEFYTSLLEVYAKANQDKK